MKNKRFKIILIIIIGLFIILEIFLREYYGFCDAVLMREDSSYEYIACANQDRFRFRKHIRYNKYSMRSDPVDTAAIIILGFGDSVINGGTLTDQDSLATTLVSTQLTQTIHHKVQVLNISAGSWGPDNCAAYLKKHGSFNAHLIFIVASSHDAHDNMDFTKVVGIIPAAPKKQYSLATYELLKRYIIPRIIKSNEVSSEFIIKKAKEFNSGFEQLNNFCQQKKIPFIVFLHPEKNELKHKKYNKWGNDIINYCDSNKIQIIHNLDYSFLDSTCYRDNIHLNEKGQRILSNIILEKLCTIKLVDQP